MQMVQGVVLQAEPIQAQPVFVQAISIEGNGCNREGHAQGRAGAGEVGAIGFYHQHSTFPCTLWCPGNATHSPLQMHGSSRHHPTHPNQLGGHTSRVSARLEIATVMTRWRANRHVHTMQVDRPTSSCRSSRHRQPHHSMPPPPPPSKHCDCQSCPAPPPSHNDFP